MNTCTNLDIPRICINIYRICTAYTCTYKYSQYAEKFSTQPTLKNLTKYWLLTLHQLYKVYLGNKSLFKRYFF